MGVGGTEEQKNCEEKSSRALVQKVISEWA